MNPQVPRPFVVQSLKPSKKEKSIRIFLENAQTRKENA